ncbi:MAG: undecaprenyl/decaprenyl-phosphate alpha-N-acetylglucosaminyl 1-phosphate transferase [Bacteroidales bacterium]|nr:undecaprenyl/decaprenyl-phosphate alpha-N-acetylglucosaminyl 1-phosphate transferase [Bacteroidales bacterium]
MDFKLILGIFFVALLLVSFFIHRYFFVRSKTILIRKARTDVVRWASQTKPILGGVTFYFSFLIGTVALFFFTDYKNLLDSVNIAVFIAVTIAFLMGLADDLLSTSPYFRFLMQFVIAVLFIYFGLEIHFFQNEYLNYFLTIFWVVGIMNSFNMLDNMDAVTTSVSLSILTVLAVFLFIETNPFIILPVMVLPALFSFLIFNWYPAKMYMGDNGSQFLGAVFSGAGIFFFWQQAAFTMPVMSRPETVIIVALVFLIPLIDTTTVTINRTLAGKSPFKGGKDHTTHFLVYRGFSESQAVLFLVVISLISNLFAMLFLFRVIFFSMAWKVGAIIFISFVFLFLYGNTKVTKAK